MNETNGAPGCPAVGSGGAARARESGPGGRERMLVTRRREFFRGLSGKNGEREKKGCIDIDALGVPEVMWLTKSEPKDCSFNMRHRVLLLEPLFFG